MAFNIWPPFALSASSVTVQNPDGSQADFNFKAIQPGIRFDLSGLTTTPAALTTLLGDAKVYDIKNDSGNDLMLLVDGVEKDVIPKGANLMEVAFDFVSGSVITIKMVSGVGTAGYVYFTFKG